MNPRLLLYCIIVGTACAQGTTLSAATVIDVWPEGRVSGSVTLEQESKVERNDGYTRITNISRPTLTLFRASKLNGKPTPAVIVCPGGGYNYVVVDKEGSDIAAWLNTQGMTALVLKYRVPNNRNGALQDLQRALSLIRARASDWNIDSERIGVIGFSAGGNVAAKASTRFDERTYSAIDDIDLLSCRPDFAILVYPAYLDDNKGQVSPDLNLKAEIPPTLIVHSEDDKPHVPGSRVYHAALDKAKISHEFKLYPTGGHGYGLHSELEARVWPDHAQDWLRRIGISGTN